MTPKKVSKTDMQRKANKTKHRIVIFFYFYGKFKKKEIKTLKEGVLFKMNKTSILIIYKGI